MSMDADLSTFVAISDEIKSSWVESGALEAWVDSPFGWIKQLAPSQKGMVAEQLIARWCRDNGLLVEKRPDSDADLLINGQRVEVKFSTLWAAGVFKFQQVRDQNYRFVVCLAIAPASVSCWVFPKEVALVKFPPQHGGAAGTDTRWLSFRAAKPPAWIAEYGGTPSDALQFLRRI